MGIASSVQRIFKRKFHLMLFGIAVFCCIYTFYYDYPSTVLFRVFNTLLNYHQFASTTTNSRTTTATTATKLNGLETTFRLMNFFDKVSNHGIPFNPKWNNYLDELGLLNVKTVDTSVVMNSTPVLATAVSSSHLYEFHNLLQSLGTVYSNTSKFVYVYDIGLSEKERTSLMTAYGKQIAELRTFNFSKYPSNFKHLRDFRWKPIIVADVLKHNLSMWWMDAAVIVKKPLDHFYKDVRRCTSNETSCDNFPWTLITPAGHSIYATTHPKMYEYMPMPLNFTKEVHMWAATLQLIFATNFIRENVLRYWVLCAFEEECMVPKDSTIQCRFGKNNYTEYANCHRHDQSAVNILLTRLNNFVERKYRREDEGIIEIKKVN